MGAIARRMRRLGLAGATALCALGCASSGKLPADDAPPPTPPTTLLSPSAAPMPAAPSRSAAALDARGFDRALLGGALPGDLASTERYYTSFYADAQPLEGFALGSAGVLAIVEGGAFAAFGNEHPGEPAPDDVRARTLAAAAAGNLTVRMIVVTDPAVSAAHGLHVGSTLAELRAAFPATAVQRMPPLWEDPTCLVEAGGLTFFLDGCPRNADGAPAPEAKVVRIVAWR